MKGGRGGQKFEKSCLRSLWTVPYLIKKWSAQFFPLFQGIPLFQSPQYQGFTVHPFFQVFFTKPSCDDDPVSGHLARLGHLGPGGTPRGISASAYQDPYRFVTLHFYLFYPLGMLYLDFTNSEALFQQGYDMTFS